MKNTTITTKKAFCCCVSWQQTANTPYVTPLPAQNQSFVTLKQKCHQNTTQHHFLTQDSP